MRHPQKPVTEKVVTEDVALVGTAVPPTMAKDPGWRIIASPPRGPEGIAAMLVALGEARIKVTNATAMETNEGVYELTVESAEAAIDVLVAIGCDVQGLIRETAPAATTAVPA